MQPVASVFVLLYTCAVRANDQPFSFSRTLGDHAVLQNPIVIWGTGTSGDSVSKTISTGSSETMNTTVGLDGIWRQALPTMKEGLEAFSLILRSSSGSISLQDLLVGKSFLCSGQSNIDLVVMKKAFNATNEIATCADYPHIRIARPVRHNSWDGPQTDLPLPMQQPWAAPDAANCAGFSATCFFAARSLAAIYFCVY